VDLHQVHRQRVSQGTGSLLQSSSWPVHPGCVADAPPSTSCAPEQPRVPMIHTPSETSAIT